MGENQGGSPHRGQLDRRTRPQRSKAGWRSTTRPYPLPSYLSYRLNKWNREAKDSIHHPINLGNLEERSVLAQCPGGPSGDGKPEPADVLERRIRRSPCASAGHHLGRAAGQLEAQDIGRRRDTPLGRLLSERSCLCTLFSITSLLTRPGDRSAQIVKKNLRPFTAKRIELCSDCIEVI